MSCSGHAVAKLTATCLGAVLVTIAGGCGVGGAGSSDGEVTITVFAAASLSDVMTELASAHEREEGARAVELSFGPSSGLREQILSGAPADLFAAARPRDMEILVDAGEVERSRVFARNGLQIAVSAGNPADISGLADFADPDPFIGLCAVQVPCGSYARQILADAGVEPSVDTEAADVRALLTQIRSGDLDAGLVYVTDVLAAGEAVEGVDIPAEVDAGVDYVIGTVTRSDDPEQARSFVRFVLSDEGRDILSSHGFGTP